jgi:hypothetical protein
MGNSDHIPEFFDMPKNSTIDVKAENPKLQNHTAITNDSNALHTSKQE